MSDKNSEIDMILGKDPAEPAKEEKEDKDVEISFKKETAGGRPGISDAELDELLSFSGRKTEPESEVHTSEKADKLIGGPLEEAPERTGERTEPRGVEFQPQQRAAQPRPKRPANTGKKKKKKKKRKSYFNGSIFGGIILVVIILTTSMVLAVAGLSLGMEYYGINKSDNEISFNIPEGTDVDGVADLLVDNGIIKNKKLFLAAVKLFKKDNVVAGDITLKASMPYTEIMDEMTSSRETFETVTITFIEGEYLTDIAAKLEEEGVCSASDFLWVFNKDQGYNFETRLSDIENTFYDREGYFFPDTYEFYIGKDDYAYNVTKIVREHFEEQITQSMYNRMDRQKMSLNEVMTLASIVQHEAASVDEMPKVASVFINRLNDPDTFPMLQSDTTSKYVANVIKPNAGNDESIEHFTEYYDTYVCVGLPAGPICNPGMDAINAVLYPEDTDFYYFCNNLETGETFYAETLEEHEKNLIRAGLVEGELDEEDEEAEVSEEE